MANNQTKLLKLINKYYKLLEKQEEIIKYLYNNTELFEQPYISDFPEELFRFFAGKIGNEARQKNTIYKLMNEKQKKEFKEIQIMEE